MNMTIECQVHFRRAYKGRKRMQEGRAPGPPPAAGAVPRLSCLMALAIRFDGLVRDGVAKDYADLARLGGITRARMTQIMNLTNLTPDIQEAILFLPSAANGRDVIVERNVRRLVAIRDWRKQRRLWTELVLS